jgi:Protein of unknown function (DUF4238)
VAQFHLAGFTSSGTRDGLLSVFDLRRRRQWETRPKGAATIRDLYRLTDEPRAAEAVLSTLETMFAPAIRRIVEERQPPHLEDRISLANFVALLHVRNPQFREMLRQHEEQSAQLVLALLTESRERWERTLSEARGRPITADEASEYPRIRRKLNFSSSTHSLPAASWYSCNRGRGWCRSTFGRERCGRLPHRGTRQSTVGRRDQKRMGLHRARAPRDQAGESAASSKSDPSLFFAARRRPTSATTTGTT